MTSTNRDRDDALKQARSAALHALPMMLRLATDGGVVRQMAGELSDKFASKMFATSKVTAQGARDLAELLPPLVEHLRYFRVQYGHATAGGQSDPLGTGLGQEWLPLNRKEQYYTATVLPLIIAGDGFAHIHRFFNLCGLDVGPFGNREEHPGFQFFTEYNFVESLRPSDLERFPDAPSSHDTPDLMFVGPDWMVAVEAKMFHDPNPQALNAQLGRQRVIIDYLAHALGIPSDRVHHVFLLPAGLNAEGLSARVVTWEAVVEAYRVVGPAYWVSLLADALGRYDGLKSVSTLWDKTRTPPSPGPRSLPVTEPERWSSPTWAATVVSKVPRSQRVRRHCARVRASLDASAEARFYRSASVATRRLGMQATVWKTGGFAGVRERLGPVDTDRVFGAVGSAIIRMVDEIRFFDLSGDGEPGQAFDDFHFSIHIVDGEREHQVSFDGLSGGPLAAKLRKFVQTLQDGGFEFEDQKNQFEEEPPA